MGGTPQHSRGNTPLPEQTEDDVQWQTDQNPHTLSPYTVNGKEGGVGGKKDVLKAYITSHYPLALVIINLLYTFKFQLVLPLKYFLPVLISTHEPFTRFFFPLLCPVESKRGWVNGFYECLAFGQGQTTTRGLCFHPAGQGSCSAGCWLHRLLSLQTKSAPVKTAGNTCNWQPLSFKDPDCRSTQIPDIYTISMSHTQLLKNQYFNCLTFPTNTCKLKTMRSRNSFILQQGFFSALIFERFLLGISIWGQNCTYESCG